MFLLYFVAVFSVGIFSTCEAYQSCAWQMFPDQHISGGELIESASTVEDCQSVCEQTADCVSFDFVPCSNQCYLLKTQEDKTPDRKVDHYDHVCVEIDPCSPDPCQNGGTCSESGQSYECSSPPGYSGKNCESYTCPDGFDYVPEIDQCLFLNLEPMTWDNARTTCASFKTGAEMVSIKDSAKQEAVTKYLQDQYTKQGSTVCLWSRWTNAGQVSWMVGQTNPNECGAPYFWKPVGAAETPFDYTNWQPKRPNCADRNEYCATIASSPQFDYRWDDYKCKALLCSLCEF